MLIWPHSPAGHRAGRTRLSRRGAVSIGCVLLLVVPVVLFVLALVWYDQTAVSISGVIVRKQETVSLYTKLPLADEPYVERVLLLHSRYTPPGSPEIIAGVRASPSRYDAAHAGDTVSLHYLRSWPRITIGLADRTARDRLRDLRAQMVERNGTWLLWSFGGLLLMLVAGTFGNVALLIASLAWLVSAWPLFFIGRAPAASPATATTAVIGDIVHVTHTPHWGTRSSILDGRHLTVPYTEVELTYVPGPGLDSVRAVDAVDSASTAPLVTGAKIPIRYDRSSARGAQLQKATREFRSRNRFDLWPETIAPAVVGVLAALLGLKRRRTAGAARARS